MRAYPWFYLRNLGSFVVGPIPRSLSMTVSGAERLRLGRSSGGNTADQPSDDGCYGNGKPGFWSRGGFGKCPGFAPRFFTLEP
jgi:hypothetical protein